MALVKWLLELIPVQALNNKQQETLSKSVFSTIDS